MAGLSRDILKWLQSLDLSYSVKNVKRDFANGFLVAEIFSRYFPHEIQMHSYDNGISLPKKLANWELLEKFFLRKRVPIGRDMIDMVIHCKGNAALPLLETIYTCLTSKKVQNVRASNDDELIPPFARATASFEVKQNIKDSELITTLQDENTKNNRTAELLQDHDRTLRQERLLEPGRFTAAAPQRSSQRVAPRPMQSEVPAGQIEFKEVQVRTLDKQNITQLRASRGPGGDRSTSMGGDGGDQSTLTDRQAGEIAVKSVKPVTAILKSCVPDDIIEKLAADEREPIVAMVDALAAKSSLGGALDDEEGSRVLEAVQKLVPELVESFISSPMELWRFLHIFSNLLHLPESTRCYDMTVDLMSQVGFKMMETDAYVASGLFMEYGLPKLVPLLSSRPPKRRRLLEMSYCFCSQLYHLKFIKSMQDALNDMPTFLHCIVVAMHQEQDFTHDLLDLYLYYAMVALGQQSASLRAAALSMLVIVAEKDESNGPTLVMPVLDKLRALKDDTWWEVSAQLVRLLAALLSNKTAALSQADDIQSLVIEILEKMQSPLAKKVAVSALAPLRPLTSGQPRLEQLYLEMLKSLSERDFSVLLALPTGQEHHVMSNTHVMMPLASPLPWLEPILVAELLAEKITGIPIDDAQAQESEAGLDNLEPEHVEILLRILHAATLEGEDAQEGPYQLAANSSAPVAEAFTQNSERWLAVLKKIELHVYVALADDELCDNIVIVLTKWIRALGDRALLTFATLNKSLKLIFAADPSPDACQDAAVSLLMLLMQQAEPSLQSSMREEITKLVKDAEVAKEMLQVLQRSPASRLLPPIDAEAASAWLEPLVA